MALDSPSALIRELGAEERVVFSVDRPLPAVFTESISSTARIDSQGEQVIIQGKNGRQVPLVSEVVGLLTEHGVPFHDLRTEQLTLEDVFLSLTGREMKD